MKKATYTQLAASNKSDVNITDDTDKTPFSIELHRPTDFSISQKEYVLPGAAFGSRVSFKLPIDGDLIRKIYFVVDLPEVKASTKKVTKPIPVERPYVISQTLDIDPPQIPKTLTVSLQKDWINRLVVKLFGFMASTPVDSIFSESEIINFIPLSPLDQLKSTTPLLYRVYSIADASFYVFGTEALSLATVAVLDLYISIFVNISQIIFSLLDGDRVKSVSELLQGWSTKVFSYSRELFTNNPSANTSILLSLLRENIIDEVVDIITETNDRLFVSPLYEGSENIAEYRLYLKQKLIGSHDDSLLEQTYIETSTLTSTEEVSKAFVRDVGIPSNIILNLRSDYLKDSNSEPANAVYNLWLSMKNLYTKILNIDATHLSNLLVPVPDLFQDNVETQAYITSLTESKDKYFTGVSNQLFYNLITFSILQSTEVDTTKTPKDFIKLLIENNIPRYESLYSVFGIQHQPITSYAFNTFEEVIPLFEEASTIVFDRDTTAFSYKWDGILYPVRFFIGEYTLNQVVERLHEVMKDNLHYVTDQTANIPAFFMTLGYSDYSITLATYIVPSRAEDLTGVEFPDGFQFPSIPFVPQLVTPLLNNPFTESYGLSSGTVYGEQYDQSMSPDKTLLDTFYPIPWSTLISWRLFMTDENQETVMNYLNGTDRTSLVELLEYNTYDLDIALKEYGYPVHPKVSSSYDDFLQKHAMLGSIFLEEMYCEYVYSLIPSSWIDVLTHHARLWGLTGYDKQVLLSYHLEDLQEVALRSVKLATKYIRPSKFRKRAEALGISEGLDSLLTFSQYIEYVRTNEITMMHLYKRWEEKMNGTLTWEGVIKVSPSSQNVPSTVIEQHYLSMIPIQTMEEQEGTDPLTTLNDERIRIRRVYRSQIETTTFTCGRVNPFVHVDCTISFIQSAAIYIYEEENYHGKETEFVWNGQGEPPILTRINCKSIMVLPYQFRKGGGGYYMSYKGLWIIHPTDANLMLSPDIVDMKRTTYPIPEVFLKYEKLRWDIYGDFNDINRSRTVASTSRRGITPNRMIGSHPGYVSWRDSPGVHIFEEARIMNGDRAVETLTPASQILHEEYLQSKLGLRRSYREMIGSIPELVEGRKFIEKRRIIVPLHFWFSRSGHTALPIASLAYSGTSIDIKMKSLSQLLLYFEQPTYIGESSFRLLIEYVYLSEKERSHLIKERSLYVSLISKTIFYTSLPSRLFLSGPVVDIYVFFTPKAGVNSTPYNAVDILDELRLIIDGSIDSSESHSHWYSLVEAYTKYDGPALPNVYVICFSLFPCELQPSGSLNFSNLTDVRFSMKYKENIEPADFNMTIVYRSYDILQVASGQLSILYE